MALHPLAGLGVAEAWVAEGEGAAERVQVTQLGGGLVWGAGQQLDC